MARNPVVGRQGPRHYAATIPAEGEAALLAVKQVRSGIGHAATMRRTLAALGLRHHQQTVRLRNTAAIRGMLYKVRHLVEVTPAKEK
jgi:large subunit ribosomal protein L30